LWLGKALITGGINAQCFEQWLSTWLFQELVPDSTLIMDNAAFHRKKVIQDLVTADGNRVLLLPKYAPDLSKIEHDASGSEREKGFCSSADIFGFSRLAIW
jgi:transposase